MRKLINSLSRTKLECLYNELVGSGEQSELTEYVRKRLERIYAVNQDFVNYSSSRMSEHSEAEEKRCLEVMEGFGIDEFSFLVDSFYSAPNKRGAFLPWYWDNPPRLITLADLNEYFSNDFNIREYEGLYNTFNYIKDKMYNTPSELIFLDYSEKKSICELKLGEIASYIKEIKDGTKLQLSIGNSGLTRSANGTYARIHSYQQTLIDAVAFGTSLEKLEMGNYEDCKRLLFLPRNIKNK